MLLPEATSEAEALATIDRLNRDPGLSGVLMLRPLPAHISEVEVFRALTAVSLSSRAHSTQQDWAPAPASQDHLTDRHYG